MTLQEIIKGLLNLQKELDVSTLPSQGLFYKDNFKIFMRKADLEDIIDYENGYVKENVGLVIYKIKKIVEKNTIISNGFTHKDIKSIDIIFIFLEIVKFTNNKSVSLPYHDELIGIDKLIEFGPGNFNYFEIDDETMKLYNSEDKCFEIEGYRFSLPPIGIENSLSHYLIDKDGKPGAYKYNSYSYNFTYFLVNKNNLSFSEIDNLIQIFNFDIEDVESYKIDRIIDKFLPLQKYSLIEDGKIIEMNAKIDLEKIWK